MEVSADMEKQTDVFMIWHRHELTDGYGAHEQVKLIGIFSCEAKAREAIAQVKDREGFRDFPCTCFEIHKTKIDQVGWADGFCTVSPKDCFVYRMPHSNRCGMRKVCVFRTK